MNGKTVGLQAGALVVALAGSAPPAAAEIQMLSQAVLQVHCSDAEGTSHPRRIQAIQPIVGNEASAVEVWPMFASYSLIPSDEAGPGAKSAAAIKKMTVAVVQEKPDGSQKQLVRFQARVRRDGAAGFKRAHTRLEQGDLLHWQVAFGGSRQMPRRECLVTILGFGQDEQGLTGLATLR